MPAVTFYGHFTGHGSYPVVCRAIANWLFEHPDVELRLCDLRREGLYEGVENIPRVGDIDRQKILFRAWAVRRGGAPSQRLAEGAGLMFGFPDWLSAIPRHELTIGYHVCDTDRIPTHWVDCINSRATRVITPSSWCDLALKRSGVKRDMSIVHHGVGDVFSPASEPFQSEDVVLRHFCSAGAVVRKGTISLMHSLSPGELKRHKIRLAVHAERRLGDGYTAFAGLGCRIIHHSSGPHLPERMVRSLRNTSLLVQPSRAEGFGLTPLESLACGTPIAATTCTGHASYLSEETPGLVPIQAGIMRPCSDGFGRAPVVRPDHIRTAILEAVERLPELTTAARAASGDVRARWSWSSVLSRGNLVDILSP